MNTLSAVSYSLDHGQYWDLRVARYSCQELLFSEPAPWDEVLREVSNKPAENDVHEW